MARSERSAGVVVYHDPGDKPRTYLLLNYGRHWDFPKGHVEKGETDEQAALRELTEETGISDVQLSGGFAESIIYFFKHARRGLIRKEVVFFIAPVSHQRVTLSHEHVGYEFLPFDQAIERVTFANAKQVLKKAEAFLLNA